MWEAFNNAYVLPNAIYVDGVINTGEYGAMEVGMHEGRMRSFPFVKVLIGFNLKYGCGDNMASWNSNCKDLARRLGSDMIPDGKHKHHPERWNDFQSGRFKILSQTSKKQETWKRGKCSSIFHKTSYAHKKKCEVGGGFAKAVKGNNPFASVCTSGSNTGRVYDCGKDSRCTEEAACGKLNHCACKVWPLQKLQK